MSYTYNIHEDDRASQYALKIVNKEIPSAIPVYHSAQKHLNDIKKSQSDKFPFYWDYKQANQIIEFSEMMINPSTNEYLELEGFQDFILGSIYGWRDEEGYRRFRLANISLARKNGKSMIQAILSIYELIFGESPDLRRQIYLGANTQGQATELFEQVEVMMDKVRASDKWIREQTKMTFNRIEHIPSYSKIEKVSEEMKNLDGKNPTVFIWDEAHEALIDRMYKAMRTGMGQQKNGLIVIISTVGYNLNSPYKKMYDDAKKIAAGEVTADRTFSYIAEGIKEDIDKPENWIKSNPLLSNADVGKTMFENMKTDYEEGLRNDDTLEFIVKNLNIWTQAQQNSFLPAREWEACYTEPISKHSRQVYLSLDLSRRGDLTACSSIYPLSDGKFYVDNHSFVATTGGLEAKSQRDKIDYKLLIDKGYATASKLRSGFIDYEQVVDYMIDEITTFDLDVQAICYDRTMIEHLLPIWEKKTEGTPLFDIPFIEVAQNYMSLSQPIKEFQFKVYERKIQHSNNPNLNLAINNAVLKYDNNNNVILDKMKAREKIDPLVALIIGWVEAMHHEYKDTTDMNDYYANYTF